MPIDFSLLSSKKAQLNGISSTIDKRTSGYKRRMNALQTAPEQILDIIRHALSNGIEASYVLMDSWFTLPPLVQAITEQGLDVIGMVKETKQHYLADGQQLSLKQLFQLAQAVQGEKGILRSIQCVMANGTPVKIVFIQNRNKKSEWLAILSTDQTLTEKEIIQIYGMRWDIEVVVFCLESGMSMKELQERFGHGSERIT